MKRRILSTITALALILSLCPAWAFAAEADPDLCPHHPEHTAECGCVPPTEGQPCTHEHTDECYTDETACVHVHDEGCYSGGVLPGEDEDKEADACAHVCTAESGCVTLVLDCRHAHDETCGYVQADPGAPCTYVCNLCPIEELIAALPRRVTADNAAEVQAQLDEILALYRELTEEEQDRLDLSRCYALQEALDAASVPAPLADEVQYQEASVSGTTVNYETKSVTDYTAVGSGTAAWNDGWYVAQGDITISDRITVSGTVNLILMDNCTLTASQGINVAEGSSLTIYGQAGGAGKLIATGADSCAGIGGGDCESSGAIAIHGGIVEATGGEYGAGIGGGGRFKTGGDGSHITIYGGGVTATGGNWAAGIGGGDGGTGSDIIVCGGTVKANGGFFGAGIGGGNSGGGSGITVSGGTVTATGGNWGAGIGGGSGGAGSDITVSDGSVEAKGGNSGAGIGGGNDGGGSEITVSGGTVTATGGDNGAGIGGGNGSGKDGSGGAGSKITVSGGSVTATGGERGAGIGGGYRSGGSEITVSGGTVEANGGEGGAGIGGGNDGGGSGIKISDGTVEANGGKNGAGIGGGSGGAGSEITVSGGKVTATGGDNGAGIGGGNSGGGSGIKISDGTVEANGGKNGAGIGGGIGGAGSEITVSGGKVTATGGEGGAGIGGGYWGAGTGITVSSGTVEATGGYHGAGIGGGDNGASTGFFTGDDGSAVIFTNSIGDTSEQDNWNGVIFQGNEGQVYGDITLTEDFEIPSGKTLTVPGGASLEIPVGVTLTNNGTLTGTGGDVTVSGTLTGSGTISKPTPSTPAAQSVTDKSITLRETSGVEYSLDGSTWKSGVTFQGLDAATQYIFYARYPADSFFPASDTSSAVIYTAAAMPDSSVSTIDYVAETISFADAYEMNTAQNFSGTDISKGGSLKDYMGQTLYVRVKAVKNGPPASGSVAVSIPARSAAPSVNVNYAAETLGTTTGMEYSTNGGTSWTDCTANMSVTAFDWNGAASVTVQFRSKAAGTSFASGSGSVTISARPAAPTSLQGTNTSFAGESDGTITGVSADMEYSADGSNWTACTGATITGLAAGTYQVRTKAAASTFASIAASVTVGSGPARTYTLDVTAPNFDTVAYGYAQPGAKAITITSSGNSDATITSVTVSGGEFTIGGSGSTVTTGDSINTWTVQPNAGLNAGTHTATITVTYNGGATATASVSFTVEGIAQDAPTAAPVEKSKTHDRVTLEAVADNANGARAQYSKDNGATWQDSPEFTGLTANTTYSFVVRYAAVGGYNPSPASPATQITTDAPPVYLVTVNGGTGGNSYQAGATVTITATVPSGKRFTGWTVNVGGVTLANANSPTTTFTMPAQAVTVTANFQSTSSNGDGGSSTRPTYPPTVVQPSEGGGVTVSTSRPERGDTVTVKPAPENGYEVAGITVTDQNGKPVEVKANSDGTYSFVQPSGKVKIEVSYKPVEPVETEWSNPFTDISKNEWYYDAVRYVQENGLMSGYGNGTFGPNDILSRAMLAQILYNKEGRPVVNGSVFDDVDSGAWCADAITWAAAQGIVGGYGNGLFGPNDPITREQLAVMLWRYAGSPAATNKELHFTDADEIGGFALEAMRWAVENGIINGYGDGRLGPKGQATRAQVAQMLMNFLKDQ